MSRSILVAAAVGVITAAGLVRPGANRAQPEPSRTVWDSVYTDSQALSGDSLYKQNCVKCHGPTLLGVDDGSPLVGKDFLNDFDGQTLAFLGSRIRNSMPPDNPKSIPRGTVTTIMAYLLAQNHLPSGKRLLVDDPDSLNDIKILTNKP